MSLLEVRDLAVDFRLGEDRRAAVKGVSFDIAAGSRVALVGESGSGKSVTALSIMRLLPPESASLGAASRILYEGRDLVRSSVPEMRRLRGASLAMIFQEPMSSLNPVFTVGFQIGEVLRRHLGLAGRALRERTVELLAEVGIPEPRLKAAAYPFQLSGGQQQRVMIAMAIACEPKLLIADEPTTALDVTVQRQIMDLIARLQARHGMAMLFISHDLAVVSEIADQVIVMRDGEVREQGPAAQVLREPRDPYTRALLAARAMRARPRRERSQAEPILLEARGLAKSFSVSEGFLRRRQFKAVKDVSFRIPRGRTLGVVGESGSGKTTVAHIVARLQAPTAGEVMFDGAPLLSLSPRAAKAYKRRIQIVFQNPHASLNPRFTVEQILTEPLLIHGIGASHAERRSRAAELLDKVGLGADALAKFPHQFSGGQRQRIAIARALTLEPELLICDEAVSALDVSVQAQLLNLLRDLQDEYAMSYLFISHDLAVVRFMADEIIVMKDGEIVESGPPDELYSRPRHPYTRLLISSIPGRAQ